MITNLLYSISVDGLATIPASDPSPSIEDVTTAIANITSVRISSMSSDTAIRSDLMFDVQLQGELTFDIITTQVKTSLETAWATVLSGKL